MPEPFSTTDEFEALFEFGDDYYDPVHLQDRHVAFSVKRRYPDSIRYKPAVSQQGEPDNVAALWVIYTRPEESRKEVPLTRVPIRVRIANMSLYRARHFDYDYEDPESPTRESIEQSLGTPKPVDLEYDDEFYFDHENETFSDRLDRALTGRQLLDRVFADHCKTVHWLFGLKLRAKLHAQSKVASLCGMFATILEFVLKKSFGRTLEESDTISAFLRGYPPTSFKKLNEDSLNLFGYKAAKPVIIVFVVVVSFVAFMRYISGNRGGYFGHIGGSASLSVVHSLLLLWLLDAVVPWLLFWTMNGLIRLRAKVAMSKLKGP